MYMSSLDTSNNSPGKACVFCNGAFSERKNFKQIIEDCDLLIAADGGAKHIAALGYTPQAIVGDMDSIDKEAWMVESRIECIQYPTDKEKTDAELAVEYALDHKCEQVLLLAATGGRLDHTLGNIALVAHYPGRVALLDDNATLVAVDKSEKCILHGKIGTLVSLLPYGAEKLTVRTKGLTYALQDECLRSATHGLSNSLAQEEACICVSGGILLVYILTPRDDECP